MSDLLNKATAAATSAANTVVNTAQQALASPTAQNLTAQAQAAATTALNAATSVAGQAHQQAHNVAPNVIPAPAAKEGGALVDQSHDLEPKSDADRAKLEKLFQDRSSADELQAQGILKGEPGDALAGKKAELEKSMLEDKLDKDLASRPSPEELVNKGILTPGEQPGK